ncbi:hypothetical protein CTU88_01985 [Streptomyces sp. JV178]|nr:hypothetical protein CTU88_01985 [Streptomyces sp. JV178]
MCASGRGGVRRFQRCLHRRDAGPPCSQPLFRFRGQTSDGRRGVQSYLGMTADPAAGMTAGPEAGPTGPGRGPGSGGIRTVWPTRVSRQRAGRREAARSGGEIPSFRIRRVAPSERLLASADGVFHGLMHPQTSIK